MNSIWNNKIESLQTNKQTNNVKSMQSSRYFNHNQNSVLLESTDFRVVLLEIEFDWVRIRQFHHKLMISCYTDWWFHATLMILCYNDWWFHTTLMILQYTDDSVLYWWFCATMMILYYNDWWFCTTMMISHYTDWWFHTTLMISC